jgi:hypothetical protein
MTSPAKAESNRANAQHSTGPRTEAGRRKVSRNAVKHGLTSSTLFIRDGEREEFDAFQRDLHKRIIPNGALEDDLYARILHASWNLRRLRELEEDLFEQYEDPFTDEEASRKMEIYARHTARFERSHQRALRDIRTLQTDRILAADIMGRDIPVGAVSDMAKVTKQSQKLHRNQSSKFDAIEKYLFADPPNIPGYGQNTETGGPIG